MQNRIVFLSLLLISSCCAVTGKLSASAIVDDFAPSTPSKQWFVCNRPENRFSFGDKIAERTTMTSTVEPLSRPKGLREKHTGCIDEDTKDYTPDGDERAELWESREVWIGLGTDIWYRFDMYVDNSITAETGRFVIGQWKEEDSGRNAPLVAQRFNGRNFAITVEQDNRASGHKELDNLCRVLIGGQRSLAERPAGWPHGDQEPVPPKSVATVMTKSLLSGPVVAKDPGCATDIRAEQYATLPDPFGKWTTMVYHLKLTPDGSSLIEIWANGKRIGKTTGRIGFDKDRPHKRQYFKFGSYRDPAPFSTTTRLANFHRSGKRNEIDPSGKLTSSN